ncbi:unnamed protein product [Alopecurus aequalis]
MHLRKPQNNVWLMRPPLQRLSISSPSFHPSTMGSAYIFFLVLATTAPLLSMAQPSYKNTATTAKPSTTWINNAASLYHYDISTVNSIVTSSIQPQTSGLAFAFTAGFTCASTSSATCSAYFFAVFIVSVQNGSLGPVSPGRIVWSANRARPVRENATLEFTSDGNLVLCDADGSPVWSSSSSGRSVSGMMITEVGNLLLFNQRNTTVWQSFGHPTDTLVPGQPLLEGMRLIANTSPTNWTENQLYIAALSSGLYAYVESTPPQLYCFYPYLVIPRMAGNDSHLTKVTFVKGSLELFGQPGEPRLNISFPESGYTQYMRLESDGHLRLYELSEGEVPIVLSDAMNINDCAYPTVCGEYGICTGGQCACPLQNNSISDYFKPVDERRPNLGCAPITPISCEQTHLHQLLTLTDIEHINLVRLIGFCVEKSERLLVYEYMSTGSLDRWIYYRHAPLDWCTRCRIILDIAKGLCYLHEECRRKIAHLDIKPQNILLDDNFNAKVADFGLCKLIDRDQSRVMTRMRGTPGYLAPEWLTSRIIEKVDVYSFGVVTMEIISGRRNIDNSQPEENVQLINLLREKAQGNQLVDLIDKSSNDMASHQEEVIQMMKLAIWCLQHDNIQRPSMSTVIKVLEGAINVETFDANSLVSVQDNPSAYSVPSQASILSGPR